MTAKAAKAEPAAEDEAQTRVLLAEDDESFVEALVVGLTREGFAVTVARDGNEALRLFASEEPDLVLLDLMLPRLSGIDVCRSIRARSSVPIIMVTAKGTEIDTVVGLEVGADDYLAKPFEPRELQARLRAILRRKGTPVKSETLRFGRLEIDKGARLVRVDGEERTITSYQFAILLALAERAGRVLSRDALMDLLKGEKLEAFDRSMDVHISRIRAAIEDDPKKPRRILTIRGAGYVFAKDQDR